MSVRTNEHQLICKDNRQAWLNLITKGTPIYDCPIRYSPRLKDLCKHDCTKCQNVEAYRRSNPYTPTKGKMPAEVLKHYPGTIFRHLVPISVIALYHHPIAQIPTSKGPVYLMRNGSNLGGYNFVIIIKNKYHWANNLGIALDRIDLETTPSKDLPLLIGRLRTEKALRILEQKLRS